MQLHRLLNQHHPCFTTLPVDAALAEAVTAMVRYGKTAVAVVEGECLQGLLTRSDLIGCLDPSPGQPTEKKAIVQVMTRNLVLSDPDTSLEHALERLAQLNIEHLPVIADGRFLTVLHEKQLLRSRIGMLQAAIDDLQEYIDNLHNAAQD
jgi:CBS domain-containing protein